METETNTYPAIVIPPGEYLAEEMEARGISQKQLAKRMRRPLNAINEIIKGKKAITAETALQLHEVMPEIQARFWLNLEADYRLAIAIEKVSDQKNVYRAGMPVVCWHHGDICRLRRHLDRGRIDLYGPNEITEKGTNRLYYWWNIRMKLKIGDRVRIVINRKIVAEANISGEPYTLPASEATGIWGSAVPLRDIQWLDEQAHADCAGHYQGSHRLKNS